MNIFKTVITILLIHSTIMAQDITTVKINELATSAISASDYFVKADANGIAYKNTLSALSSFIGSVGVSGYKGVLAIADTPTEDGFYFASESGTYTNAGGLVVDLNAGINIISVTEGQTVFSLAVIPVDLSGQLTSTVDQDNTANALNGLAVESYFERFAAFEEYKNTSTIGYADKIHNDSATFLDVTIKQFYAAFAYIKLYGFDKTRPHKLWFLARNEAVHGYRFRISEWDGGAWVTIFDTATSLVVTESSGGVTHVSYTGGAKKVEFGVDYSVFPDDSIIRPNHYRLGGGFDTGANDTELIIKKTCFVEPIPEDISEEFESLANMEDSGLTKPFPRDKSTEVFTNAGGEGTVYGFSDTYFTPNNLDSFVIQAKAAGDYKIDFRVGDNFDLIHTYTGVSTGVGRIEIPFADLGLPDISSYSKITPFVGNLQTAVPNVFMYASSNPVARQWWLITGAGSPNSQTSTASFNFWLRLKVNYPIINEINALRASVDSFPTLYNYQENAPILPRHIFIVDERTTALYRKSMFSQYSNKVLPEVILSSNGVKFDIGEPTNLKGSDLGTTARLIVNKNTDTQNILFKDISIIKSALSDKVGKTITIMSLGDSLTEGGAGFTSSPIYLLTQQLQSLGITVQGVGTLQRTSGSITQQYEGRGAWRYRTFVGLESKFSGLNIVLPSPTQPVWIEGVDGNMNTIKANNTFLYPATAQDLIDYPEWCFHFVSGSTVNNESYAQNPSLGTYHIFDPARYLSERGKSAPDMLTIALGTNEWYLAGFSGWDLPLITSCVDWMITRFRQAMPTTKIIVIPCNNLPLSRETEWQTKASFLTSSVLKVCETKVQAGDANLFTLSIFAQGSRVLAYDALESQTELSADNTVKVGIIDNDVHMLNVGDDSRADYMKSLTDCVICLA